MSLYCFIWTSHCSGVLSISILKTCLFLHHIKHDLNSWGTTCTQLQALAFKQKTGTSDILFHSHAQCHNVSTECATGCCSSAPLWSGYYTSYTGVRTTNTELFSGYDLRQRIAYRIGQVECLKSLLSEENTQYGLGALHRGDYTTDITRFSLRQRIAFLMGQVQCLKIHLSLEGIGLIQVTTITELNRTIQVTIITTLNRSQDAARNQVRHKPHMHVAEHERIIP